MKPIFHTVGFSPEQSKALSILRRKLPLDRNCVIPQLPPAHEMCQTGKILVVEGHILTSNIPRGENWLWNQSRARQQACDRNGTMKIQFCKLNTRKTKVAPPTQVTPSLKIWIFHLHYQNSEKYSAIWCEKGFKESSYTQDSQYFFDYPSSSSNIVGSDSCEELSIHQFQFLRPFVSDSVAISLGWAEPDQLETEFKPHSL